MTNRLSGGPADQVDPGGSKAASSPGAAIWLVAEWSLLVVWIGAALVTMYPGFGKALQLSAGLFTSYAADVTFPAWFYIQLRRRPWRILAWVRWFGRSPELAAGSIFVVGVLSEAGQFFWPKGLFRGTFDPLDIAAYGLSVMVCYAAERHDIRRRA